jgi:hypothetical protein
VVVHDVAASHFELLMQPAVQQLAAPLSVLLERELATREVTHG